MQKAIKGVMRVTVSVMVPRPENPEVGDMMDAEPVFFDIPEISLRSEALALKTLPPGALVKVRKLMEDMAELVRNHVHGPMKEKPPQIEQPTAIKHLLPQAQLYINNGKQMLPVGQPVMLDSQGFEMVADND